MTFEGTNSLFDKRVYAQDSAPVDERNGNLWADTSVNPPVLKVYSTDTSNWERASPSNIKVQDTAPTGPAEGDGWVDTSESPPQFKIYDGTNWEGVGNRGVDQKLEFQEAKLLSGEMNKNKQPDAVISEYTSGKFEWSSGQDTEDNPTFEFYYPPGGVKQVFVTVEGNASSVDVVVSDKFGNTDRVDVVQNTTVTCSADYQGQFIEVQVVLNDSLYTQAVTRCQLKAVS